MNEPGVAELDDGARQARECAPVPSTADLTGALLRRNANTSLRTATHWAVGVAVLLAAAGLPYYGSPSILTLATTTLVLGVLSLSTGFLLGMTGLPSMGQAAYYGIGGYVASSVAVHLTSGVAIQLALAILGGACAAGVVGCLIIRTTGVYFLMITLAVGEIARELSVSLSDITGGSDGLPSPPGTLFGNADLMARDSVYWYILGVSALILLILYLVKRSKVGRQLGGIAQSETRMRSLGYRTPHMKYVAFVFAGGIAGAGGALSVAMNNFMSPTDLGFETSALALFAVLIGGRRSFVAAFAGALLIVVARDKIGPSVGGHADLVLGVLFVSSTLLIPRGFAGLSNQWSAGIEWYRGTVKPRLTASARRGNAGSP